MVDTLEEKGNSFSAIPLVWLLQAKVNILPSVLSLLAEAVVTTLKLHYLEFVLLCSNLSWRQLSKLAGEGNKASAAFLVSEDAALEHLT